MTLQSHFHSTNMQLFYTYYTCKVCTFRHLIGPFEILQTSPGRSARTIFFSTHKITLLTSKTTQLFSYLDVLIHYSRFFILKYMSRNISFFAPSWQFLTSPDSALDSFLLLSFSFTSYLFCNKSKW